MFLVAGQRVKVVTGVKSQTVRVYGAGGGGSACQHTIRLSPPVTSEADLVARGFESVDALLDHLTNTLAGQAVRTPSTEDVRDGGATVRQTRRGRVWPREHVPLSAWGMAARDATERAIDALVKEFCRFPMLHRVEHSIHCRLFQLLTLQPELQTPLTFRDGVTQPVHKEWPEFIARPEKANLRRGNFDLAILAPEIVADATLDEFREGRIRPSIVIEVGMDYGLEHLLGDIRKLDNSGIQDSYLIHLVRDGVPDDFAELERHIAGSAIKVAYARHTRTAFRCKTLDATEISTGMHERVSSRVAADATVDTAPWPRA